MTARFVLLAVLALTLAACSGGDDKSAQAAGTTTAATSTASEEPVGEPAESVEDFLGAIESADQNLAWGLLSSDTKVTFQIDKQHWVETLMPALKKELSPTSKVLFSKRFGKDKAVVVVDAGRRKTPVAFALRGEQGEWHMQLFYPEFSPTRPAPGETVKAGKTPLLFDVVHRRDATLKHTGLHGRQGGAGDGAEQWRLPDHIRRHARREARPAPDRRLLDDGHEQRPGRRDSLALHREVTLCRYGCGTTRTATVKSDAAMTTRRIRRP